MQKIKYIFFLLLLGCFSCVKNGTVTDFADVDGVVISGVEPIYNMRIGGMLIIDPVITPKSGVESDFDYVWYKYNVSDLNSLDTISRVKKLEVRIDDVPAGVEHFINLKVTNRKTGTFDMVTSRLFTNAYYADGALLLVKTDGHVDLTFISNTTGAIEPNLYSTLNDGKYLSDKATKVFCENPVPSNAFGVHKRVIVAVDDNTGGVVLNNETLKQHAFLFDNFAVRPSGEAVYSLTDVNNSQGGEFYIINGKVYDRSIKKNDVEATKFNNPLVCDIMPYDYKVSPLSFSSMGDYGSIAVYDEAGGRIMRNDGTVSRLGMFPKPAGTAAFLPGELPGMELICSGLEIAASTDSYWLLMKEKSSGNFRVLRFKNSIVSWSEKFSTTSSDVVTKANAPMLFRAKEIISTSLSMVSTYPFDKYYQLGTVNMALYVVDNSVWAFNMTDRTEFELINGNKEGFTIDRVLSSDMVSIGSDGKPIYTHRVGLCIKDNSAVGRKGGVAFYKIDLIGGVTAKQYFKKVGFCDEVIHFEEKAV